MPIDLYWQGDKRTQYLFAGENPNELARLDWSNGKYVAAIFIPGVIPPKGRDTLLMHKKNIEERAQQWFRLAAGVVNSIEIPVE